MTITFTLPTNMEGPPSRQPPITEVFIGQNHEHENSAFCFAHFLNV